MCRIGLQSAPVLKSNVFKCNLVPKDVQVVFARESSHFWFDVMLAWFTFQAPQMKNYLPNAQTLWLNSNVRIDDKPVFFPQAYTRGLLWVSQLYPNQHLISIREANEKYELSFMQFYALVAAIPAEWRARLKNNTVEDVSIYDQVLPKKHLSRLVYKQLIDNTPSYSQKLECWGTDLQCDVNRKLFLQNLASIYVTTNIAKHRSFQYRFAHRALVLNTHLYRWGKNSDNLCTFCGKYKETIVHLFIDCEVSKKLWDFVATYIFKRFDTVIQMTRSNIVWNCIASNKKSAINTLCLITKQFLYAQRCKKTIPDANCLKSIFDTYQSVEKYIATKNNKLDIYNEKWKHTEYSSKNIPLTIRNV